MNKSIATESDFNITQIREKAMRSMGQGAVTEDYPLDIEQACILLNKALASEILCVLRYRHHQIAAKGINNPQVAAEFREHAESEERHMLLIAERIDQLGGDPDMNPATISARSATEYGTNADLITMIREDLIAERIAIEVYRQMITWFGSGDPTSRRMFRKFLQMRKSMRQIWRTCWLLWKRRVKNDRIGIQVLHIRIFRPLTVIY